MKNHKLNGPDYLVLNHDIAARKIDRDKAVQALAGLRLVAKDLGLPGKYLADSIGRFLDQPKEFPSLDSAFGVAKAAGGQAKQYSKEEAKVASLCLEQRLSGAMAKQVEVEGYSLRALQRIQEEYRIESIETARRKRGNKGFSQSEQIVINRILARGRSSVIKIIEDEKNHRSVATLDI